MYISWAKDYKMRNYKLEYIRTRINAPDECKE